VPQNSEKSYDNLAADTNSVT